MREKVQEVGSEIFGKDGRQVLLHCGTSKSNFLAYATCLFYGTCKFTLRRSTYIFSADIFRSCWLVLHLYIDMSQSLVVFQWYECCHVNSCTSKSAQHDFKFGRRVTFYTSMETGRASKTFDQRHRFVPCSVPFATLCSKQETNETTSSGPF